MWNFNWIYGPLFPRYQNNNTVLLYPLIVFCSWIIINDEWMRVNYQSNTDLIWRLFWLNMLLSLQIYMFIFLFSPSLESDDEMYRRIDTDSSVEELLLCKGLSSTNTEENATDIMLVH
jgi:hypothetical protein